MTSSSPRRVRDVASQALSQICENSPIAFRFLRLAASPHVVVRAAIGCERLLASS
jgi:hypothetical protein